MQEHDDELVTETRSRIREFVAAEVVTLIQSMALARGKSPLPSIAGADAAAALTAVAGTLERGAAEMMALAALALPGWELAVSAEEVSAAEAVRANARERGALDLFAVVREIRGSPGQG